ncbi:MAG: hypothetical protein QW751_00780 [Candidatus Aenigmatarchaeota archaeon]|nr:hypothetical protein [Candidatus Aenigmarchaeota archaeon]
MEKSALRGQAQIIVFVLLLLISLILVFTAVSWGGGISQQNIDVSRVIAAENWMKELDRSIQSVVKSGGSARLNYPFNTPIGLADVDINDYIEMSMPVSIDLPDYWINISISGEPGLIRERKDAGELKLRLSYPLRPGFAIDLFTDGPQIATPKAVLIEHNSTFQNSTITIVKIKLSFI